MRQGKVTVNYVLQRNALLNRNIYTARPEIYTQIDHAAIVAYAAKAAGIHESDMLTTLEALVDAFSYYICNGHSFKLDGIGTFSLSLNAASADPTNPMAATGASAVQSVGINFLADKSLKMMLSQTSVTTVASNPSKLVEEASPILTSISSQNYSLNCIGMGLAKGFYLERGPISFKGYNFTMDTKVIISGTDGEPATIRPTFVNKAQNIMTSRYDGNPIPTVTKVTLYEGEQKIAEYDVTGAAAGETTVSIGNVIASDGAAIVTGTYDITVRGSEVGGVVVKLDNNPLTATTSTATRLVFKNVLLSVGSHVLKVDEKEYNLNVTAEATANVTQLTSNGVSVPNNGTSTMIAGHVYSMVASGNNLSLINKAQITAGNGLTLSGIQITDTQIKFACSVTEGYEGASSINIGSYFKVNITVPSGEEKINTIGGVSNNGTLNPNDNESYDIVGTKDLAGVVAYVAPTSNPSATRESAAVTVNASQKKLIINKSADSSLPDEFIVYLREGDTTIFTVNMSNDVSLG